MIVIKAAASSKYIFKHTLHISSRLRGSKYFMHLNDNFVFIKIIVDGSKLIDWIEFYAVSAVFSNVKAATISKCDQF